MDLVLLKTFLKVAATGSITKAAAVLFVTQSAVSRRIKQLEDYAGKPLLVRTGSSLVPTEEGYSLIDKGRKILDLEKEFFNSIRTDKNKQKISFCCTPSLGLGYLGDVISSFVTQHVETIDLNCTFTMPEEALEGIDLGRFDVAMIDHCEDIDLKDRITCSLPDNEAVFVSAPSLSIAPKTDIARILGERLYLIHEKKCAKRFIDRNLRKLGRAFDEFSSIVYFDDVSFILREVLAGKGITFVPIDFFPEELQRGRLCAHRVDGFNHCLHRSMVLARQELSAHHLSFIDKLFERFGMSRPEKLSC